jgi:hypothetical protein
LYGISFDKQSAICCVLFCTHCICVAESQLVYVLCYANLTISNLLMIQPSPLYLLRGSYNDVSKFGALCRSKVTNRS